MPKPLRRLRNVIDRVVTSFVVDIAISLVVATTGGGACGDWLLSSEPGHLHDAMTAVSAMLKPARTLEVTPTESGDGLR